MHFLRHGRGSRLVRMCEEKVGRTQSGEGVTRRGMLRGGSLWAAQAILRPALGPVLRGLAPQVLPVAVQVATEYTPVPANFAGLGYEMSSVAQADLLSDRNSKYVQMVMNLGAKGVLRLGGIVADFTQYSAAGPARAEAKDTVIDRASLVRLRSFLDATGWTAIWSVNFGKGTLPEAIEEARAVHKVLGPTLEAIELGNEVENYGHGSPTSDSGLRPAPYTFDTYLAEYRVWHHRLAAAVPKLRFAAPDTAASIEWVEQMAAHAKGDVQLLTTHYYRGDQREGALDQLMRPDAELLNKIARLRVASRQSGIPWRLCETNSFFGGGRPGLSDTFAAALWTLQLMLELACGGCAGLNLETGRNQLGFMSSYSPIRTKDHSADLVEAGPSYYGMLAFAAAGAAGAEIAPLKLDTESGDLYGYEVRKQARRLAIVFINWSPGQIRMVRVPAVKIPAKGRRAPVVLRLTAAGLSSRHDVSFGGAQVDRDGMWESATSERAYFDNLEISAATAVVVRS